MSDIMVIQSKSANRIYNGLFSGKYNSFRRNDEIFTKESENKDNNLVEKIKKSKKNPKGKYNLAHFFYTWGVFLSLVMVSVIAQLNFPTGFNILTNTHSIILDKLGHHFLDLPCPTPPTREGWLEV